MPCAIRAVSEPIGAAIPHSASGRRGMDMRRGTGLLLLAVVVSNGCASLAHGSKQPVLVTSDPSEADVFVGGQHRGITPLKIELPRRRRDLVVRFEKAGYGPAEVALKRQLSA